MMKKHFKKLVNLALTAVMVTSIMFGNISYPPFIQKSIKIIAQNHFMCNGVFLTESEFERQSKPCHLPRPRLRTGVIICCSACAFSCSSEE